MKYCQKTEEDSEEKGCVLDINTFFGYGVVRTFRRNIYRVERSDMKGGNRREHLKYIPERGENPKNQENPWHGWDEYCVGWRLDWCAKSGIDFLKGLSESIRR